MKNTVRLGVLVAVGLFAACKSGGPKPPKITLPVSAVSVLAGDGGVPVGLIDSSLLSLLDDTSAKRLIFQQEWRDAPSMTMASINFDQASLVDATARFKIKDLTPIETEFAVCDSQTVNGVQQSIPPNADGKWEPIHQQVFPFIQGSDEELLINRVSGEIYNLRITPDAGAGGMGSNEFALSFGIRNFRMGFGLSGFSEDINATDSYFATFPNFSVSCTGQITAEVPANVEPQFAMCGEQNVHCVPGTVQIQLDGPTTNMPSLVVTSAIWLASTSLARPVMRGFLEDGVRLHFENFAASSLAFNGLGDLKLGGVSTMPTDGGISPCSPMPIASPPLPKTRGLVQVLSHDGHGETQSTDGYVREYPIAPYLYAEFQPTSGASQALMSDTRLRPTGNFEIYAAEFPAQKEFDVAALSAQVRAQRGEAGCWQKRAVVNDIVKFGDLPPLFGRFGSELFPKKDFEKIGTREFRALGIHQADPKEVQSMMTSLGLGDCGSCNGYWQLDGLIAPPKGFGDGWPFPPPDGTPPKFDVPPWEGHFYFDRDPSERFAEAPWLRCDLKVHSISRDVVINQPDVWFSNAMFDSAQVVSSSFAPQAATNKMMETSFQYFGTQRLVVLKPDCWASRATCWYAKLPAPLPSRIAVSAGFSGTTIPRMNVRTAVPAMTTPSYGNGLAAVWGFFDRSVTDLYTEVPDIYRRAGITQATWDWRGQTAVDWDHTTYAAPGGKDANDRPITRAHQQIKHPAEDWFGTLGFDTVDTNYAGYRADFTSDRLLLRRRSGTDRSFCTSSANLTAEATTIRFITPQGRVDVPAKEIFQPDLSTQTVRVIDASATGGSTAAYFRYAPP